jgi:hypothetical protein
MVTYFIFIGNVSARIWAEGLHILIEYFSVRSSVSIVLVQYKGRAIAQAFSCWLPTAVVRVRARVWSSVICGGKSGTRAGFLLVLRIFLPIFIPPNSPSSQSPWEGTMGQKWPTCRMDPVWTPTPIWKLKKIINSIQNQFLLLSSTSQLPPCPPSAINPSVLIQFRITFSESKFF